MSVVDVAGNMQEEFVHTHVCMGQRVLYRTLLYVSFISINIKQYLSAPCARCTLGPIAPCSTVRMTKLWSGGAGWVGIMMT